MAIIYNASVYAQVLEAKKIADDYIGELYSSLPNKSFKEKIRTMAAIDGLRQISFEFEKYIIIYQRNNSSANSKGSYIVIEGDTLPLISSRVFGDPFRWADIFNYNNLSDTALQAGQILKIPEE